MKLIKRKDTKESIKLQEKERKKIIRILCNATVLYLFAKHIVYMMYCYFSCDVDAHNIVTTALFYD